MTPLADDIRPPSVTMLAVTASVCAHILSLAVPLALLQTYDRILPNEAYSTTFVLAAGVTVAIILEALLRYGRAVLFAHVGAAFESRMTPRLLDHVLRANGKAVHALGTPALSDALRAVGQVREFWSGSAAASLHELPFVVIYIGLIAYIASWIALIPLALTVIALIAALLVARAINDAVSDVEATEIDRRNLVWGIFKGIVEVKAMAAETTMTRRYRDSVAKTMDASARVENLMALIRENGSLLAQISTIGVVTAGAFMMVAGQLTTGGLAACTLLAGRSIGPAMGAFSYLARLAHRKGEERKIAAVLSLPEAPLWIAGSGEKTFHGGTVGIAGDAIEGSPRSIRQGSVVHVESLDAVAATALLEAVAQLDNSLGLTITFDNEPCAAFNCLSIKNRIAMATANTELIRGSLLDNLTLFSPQFDAEAIRLTQQLGLAPFVDGLRQGFMTPIGPAASELVSPGIAVRIDLIRALVRRPSILCLDEVGGALDLDGTRRLLEILKGLKGQTTIFLVSGNPSLLALADEKIRVTRSPDHD
ncbi:MAG: ABC transporter transmembrane domain-containing protein [Hyphomicrobium sp.]|uniref:ABC transporter transmembrane domain-containing protein n=1 Tax=Hyphomicrobium sp. TaxID=82 RepID=UPI0039E4FF67